MQLIGSLTSPYVRRIRLLLGETTYDFENLDIYGADRDELRRHNPALKIPILIDGERELFDSRVISRYLIPKLGVTPPNWAQENQLTLIDAVNDAGVLLFQSKLSGFDPSQEALFYNLQNERIQRTMTALSALAEQGAFDDWHYPAMCLYCLIDWVDMREIFRLDAFESLLAVRERHRHRPMVAATNPRNA